MYPPADGTMDGPVGVADVEDDVVEVEVMLDFVELNEVIEAKELDCSPDVDV